MANPIPPELQDKLIEIVGYVLTFIGGIISKWIHGKNKQPKTK